MKIIKFITSKSNKINKILFWFKDVFNKLKNIKESNHITKREEALKEISQMVKNRIKLKIFELERL